MSYSTYNIIAIGLGIAVYSTLAIAILSLGLMIFRWRTPQRRKHVVRLLVAVVTIPCLIGIHFLVINGVYIPALVREQRSKTAAYRAEQLTATSLIHVGDRAPDFEIIDADGATFSMADAKGKVVVINFFATWCGPCMMELPHVEELWTDHRGQDNFALLVIGREESMDAVRDFRSKKGFSFPIAPDPDRAVFSMFAKQAIPRTIVVSPNGVVVYSQLGFNESDMDELRAVVTEQLAGLE